MADECERRLEQVSVTPGQDVLPNATIARTVSVTSTCRRGGTGGCLGGGTTRFDVIANYNKAKRMGEQKFQQERNICPFNRRTPGQLRLP